MKRDEDKETVYIAKIGGKFAKRTKIEYVIEKKDNSFYEMLREAAKKGSFLNGQAIKRGGGCKGPAIKEFLFIYLLFKIFCCHLKIKIILL